MSFGVIVNERTQPVASTAITDTSKCFVAARLASGPTGVATVCSSLDDVQRAYGPRAGASTAAWDWLDVAFREGLSQAVIAGYPAPGGYNEALALFDARQGPGQVAVVGEPATAAVYTALQAHVDTHNRIALLDVTEGDVITDIEAHGDAAQDLDIQERVGVFGSWAMVPGPAGVAGVGSRLVPASAVIAGLCSRVDETGNPNRAAGGFDFPLLYVSGFEFDPSDVDRAACFQHGVNMFANRFGTLQNYGFQTPVAQSTTTPFWQLNCSRARMWLKARAQAIGDKYYMRTIDGRGVLAGRLGAELEALCAELWNADGLFGDTAEEAYNVNVGVQVNTTADAAEARLRAVVQARLSQYAKQVVIDLVSVPVLGTVA